MYKILLVFLLLMSNLLSYESEDKLKVVIVGKVVKFITWDEQQKSGKFVISVLKNPFETMFDDLYKGKSIQGKNVELKYIENIDELEDSNVLYIPNVSAAELNKILKKIENQKILTISDMRGFVQRGGMIQIGFSSQKAKLKINVDNTAKANLEVKASLLKISDVVKGVEL